MSRTSKLALLLYAGLALAGTAQAVPETLLRNSPFQPTGSAAPTTTPPSRLELRGLISEGGVPRFSIFDASNSRAYWIGLNETEGGVRVVSFDASSNSIMVEADGQAQRLVMKEAQIVAMAVPLPGQPNTIVAPPGAMPPPPSMGAGSGPQPPTEQEIQERRNRIVEELRRRRALRANAQPPPGAPAQQ